MKTRFFYLACALLMQLATKAQVKIGDNSTTINNASLLELETTNKGFVLPRVSIANVSAASPLPAGLLTGTLVYNTNAGTTGGSGVGIYIWDGSAWLALSTGSSVSTSAWLLTGNSGLNSLNNFIGTTDAVDFVTRTANTERMRILGAASGSSKAGWIGMGISVPRSSLDVTGDYTNKNVFTIQNTSSTGYSSVDMMDNTGVLKGTFGYANAGTSGNFAGRLYFNTYGSDFLLTSNSGTSHFFMKGGTGYIGVNTSTPSERLHVVGNIYLNGAFMPGGSAGTSGYVLTSAGANTSPIWTSSSSLGWALTGNSGTSYATNFLGTTDFVSLRFRTGNIQRMIIDSIGRVGIGINNPSYALSVLSQTNPLYLSGVQATSTFSTDSVLTINAGIVKKTPYSSLNAIAWNLTGNSGLNATTNFIGTTDNVSMRFRTNNVQRMIIDSIGRVGIGTNTPSEKLDISGNLRFSGALMPNNTAGSAGYFLVSSGANNPPTWFDASNYAWQLDGNPVSSIRKFGTTTNYDIPFITNNVERMRLTAGGLLGIGTTNPVYPLSIVASSNPLYLSGVQATSTFNTDSVLTINGGVVKKAPYSSLTGNFWGTTGNSGIDSATNFIGTKDNATLRFRTNNTERMSIDTSGMVSIGDGGVPSFNPSNPPIFNVDYGTTSSNTIAYLRGNENDYLQMNIRNKSNGLYASSDYVATADNGTDSTYYVDMGINGSGYGTGADYFGGPNDAYLYAYSKNLLIGTQKASTDIIFLLNGGSVKNNTAMRIASPGGNIVIGKGEASNAPVGNIVRGPNASTNTNNIAGGSLTLQGGSATGTAAGGNLNLYGGTTVSGTLGAVNINTSTNSATNINTGTSTSIVTIGNTLNNVNLPKLSAASVVLTDASKNLTSTTPSSNTYLYYDGTNFTWSAAATLGSFSAINPLTYDNTTGVFAINKATALADGYLSATDWNTFNNKVGSITLNTPSSIFSNPINFSVSSGAATGSLSLNTQVAGTVFAGPVNAASGTLPAVPTFRALVAADIPSLAGSYIQNQTTLQSSSNFNISGNGTIGTNLSVTGTSTLTGLVTSKAGHTNIGAFTTSGGDVSINVNSNNTTSINSGTSTSNVTIGNSSNNILFPKFNTTGGIFYTGAATGQIANTGSGMTWDNTNSRLGIGITNPSYKLSVLAASNPLYLSGVQATSTLISDSILTINSGVVKKSAYSSFSDNFWSLTGNDGTTVGTNFIGTTDAIDFVTKTNNAERIRITSGGLVGIGTSTPSSDLTLFQSTGSGSSRGFTFTGNSIGGTNSGTGFLMSLGYNTSGNKQLWLGDADYAGNASGSFARFVTSGTNFPVFDAVSGDNALRRYIALGVASDANSGVIFGADNTSVKPGSQVWDNGNMTIGNGYKSYAAPSNGLLVQGNVGIGTASPSSALSVIAASNPLYLSGVQATLTFTTDSVLTINAGVVKKTPYSSLSSGSSGWSLTGNSGTSAGTNFLGTTDAQPLIIKSLNRQLAYFDGNLYSIALGFGAVNNSSDHNVAIGYNASTNNQYALALGYNASATGVRSVAIGNGGLATTASGAEAIAIGYNATANNVQTTALGYQAQATGQYGVAIGYNPTASGIQSVAIGYQAQATQQYSNAIGYQAQATGTQSTAIGYKAQTSQSNTILLGDANTTTLRVGIGTATPSAKLDIVATAGNNPLEMQGLPTGTVGTDNILTINSSGVVGYATPAAFGNGYWSTSGNAATSSNFLGTTNTTALQFKFNSTLAGYLDANNTALGTSSASTAGSSNTAIGFSATASNSATAIGANAVASLLNNTAIGNSALANTSSQATAIGASSQALFQYNTAVGYNAQATVSSQETVIGSSAQAQGQNNIAIGYSARANGSDKMTVVGSNAQASFQNNTVVGSSALATTNNQATAIGATAVAQAQNATALGYGASATGINSTAIGSSASTSQTNALVLGTSTTNVGIGTSTPNTSTKLDVAGYVKLGSNGTVTRNVISLTNTISSVNIPAQYTATTVVFTPNVLVQNTNTNYIDVTFTLPAAATNTTATVIVSPSFDLPDDIVIAFARLTSATQGKIRFLNIGTSTRTLSGTVSITVIDF